MEDGGEVAGNAFASGSGVASSEGSEVEKPALSITPPGLDSGCIRPPNEARSERGPAFDGVMPKFIEKSIFDGVGGSAIDIAGS